MAPSPLLVFNMTSWNKADGLMTHKVYLSTICFKILLVVSESFFKDYHIVIQGKLALPLVLTALRGFKEFSRRQPRVYFNGNTKRW